MLEMKAGAGRKRGDAMASCVLCVDNVVVTNTLEGRLAAKVLLLPIQRRKDCHSLPSKALAQNLCPFKRCRSLYLLPWATGEL